MDYTNEINTIKRIQSARLRLFLPKDFLLFLKPIDPKVREEYDESEEVIEQYLNNL